MSEADDAWNSYFEPGTKVLRNVRHIRDLIDLALYESDKASAAQLVLRQQPPPERFDLDYLRHCHRELFRDVYPFAGDLRHVGMAKTKDPERPFVPPEFIEPYFDALAAQLHREGELRHLTDGRHWADRAGYYWGEANRCHPFREGNGRSTRLFFHQLAEAAGQQLDWQRVERDLLPWVIGEAGRHAHDRHYEAGRVALQYAATGTLERSASARDQLDRLDRVLARELYVDTHIRAGLGWPGAQQHLASLRRNVDRKLDALGRSTGRRVQAPTRELAKHQPTRGNAAPGRDAGPSGGRLRDGSSRSRDQPKGHSGRGYSR